MDVVGDESLNQRKTAHLKASDDPLLLFERLCSLAEDEQLIEAFQILQRLEAMLETPEHRTTLGKKATK
jgi:hypothetical protein